MRDCDDLDIGPALTENDEIRKAAEESSASFKFIARELCRLLLDSTDRVVDLVQKSLGCALASLPVPVNRRFCVAERRRVDRNEFLGHLLR